MTPDEQLRQMTELAGANYSAIVPWGEFLYSPVFPFPAATKTVKVGIQVNPNPYLVRRKLYFSISATSGFAYRIKANVLGIYKGAIVFIIPHEFNLLDNNNADFRLDVAATPTLPANGIQVDDEPFIYQIPNSTIYASVLPLRMECVIDTFGFLIDYVDNTGAALMGGIVAAYSEFAIGKAERRL